jgi:integrase
MTDIPNSRKPAARRVRLLKYIQPFVDRATGRPYTYFRRAGYPRVRLPGLPGSAEFMAAYQAALGTPPAAIGVGRNRPGSVSHAVASYFGSTDFRNRLTPSTQAIRRVLLEKFRRDYGDMQITTMPRRFIDTLLSTLRPGAQKNWLKALRGLLQYCVGEGLCKEDVTATIKLAPSDSEGFHSWTDDEIAQFEARHPVGSKARLAHALLLYTGQRRGDVIRMGRQHVREVVRDGVPEEVLTITQQKTGTTVAMPVHPELRAIIDASANTNLTFIVTERGKPFPGPRFTQWFRRHCDAAGLPKRCVPHGLRKAAGRKLAEAGCTAHEIMAILGHTSLKEAERYTKAFDRAKLARSGMARLGNETATPSVKTVKI